MIPAPAPRLAEVDLLDRLVTLVDAASTGEGWFQPHRLVMVETDRSDPSVVLLGQRALPEGVHPLDHLLGFRAPDQWLALGAVCFGWAAPSTTADVRHGTTSECPSAHPERRRVRVVTLVDRTGNACATAALDDGTVTDEPPQGAVVDALRRCLGVPTPPPPTTTAELFAVMWLQRLLSAPRGISWAEAAQGHPASAWLRSLGRRPGVDDLTTAGRALADTLDWRTLRTSVVRQSETTLVAPELAAWMDDGMFARWVLANYPPLPALLEALEVILAPAFLGRVKRTLEGWALKSGAG
ncbi:MAG: hypothetical protein KY458_00590 [Actinobacteria bacterium]|nr:hypothetical protein [Actinomycetota bacterium]